MSVQSASLAQMIAGGTGVGVGVGTGVGTTVGIGVARVTGGGSSTGRLPAHAVSEATTQKAATSANAKSAGADDERVQRIIADTVALAPRANNGG